MLIKGITDEDVVNYKKMSMFIATNECDFKCDKLCGCAVCQNGALAHAPSYDVAIELLFERYAQNPLTSAVVFGGLEPFLQINDILNFISELRTHSDDDVVIYTGYNKDEVAADVERLKQYKNIIIKFGRYVPNQEPHYDNVLGVRLASKNQYAVRVS